MWTMELVCVIYCSTDLMSTVVWFLCIHTPHFSPTFRPNRDVNCLICLPKKKPGQKQILTGRQGREFAGGVETIKACELEDPSEGQNTASAQSGRGELSILSFLLPQAGCQRYQTQNLSIIFRHLLHALI